MQQCPLESLLRPCASQLDGSEPLVLAAATRFSAVALVAAAALEQLATPPVPTYGEPLGIEVDIDSLDVVIVLTLGLSYSADLHKSIRPTRSAARGARRTSRSPVYSTCAATSTPLSEVRRFFTGDPAIYLRFFTCRFIASPTGTHPFPKSTNPFPDHQRRRHNQGKQGFAPAPEARDRRDSREKTPARRCWTATKCKRRGSRRASNT